ncbi:MAG: hypothetical protein ABIR32_00555, partial [Ilumatobacteraceae bacterium]
DEIIANAREARPRGAPPLLVTVWQPFEEALLDPDGVDRRRYDTLGIDRLIIVQFDPVRLELIRQR